MFWTYLESRHRLLVGKEFLIFFAPGWSELPCVRPTCATSFDADQTRRKLGEEFQDLATAQMTADNNFALVVNAINLKYVLRDIQTNCANLINGWLVWGVSCQVR